MGLFPSKAVLPPDATLQEITNRDFNGPMQFAAGLYSTFPVRLTSKVIETFAIERRRHIQRVRRVNQDFNDIILSYSTEDSAAVCEQLSVLGITTDLMEVPLPLWCPFSEAQRSECQRHWPMTGLLAPDVPEIEPISAHLPMLQRVLADKSVLVVKAGASGMEIIASDAICDCIRCDSNIDHGAMRALRAASRSAPARGAYLCTGLDVYCYHEPCIMCAMAMVHSRVAKLFYIERNPEFGGIESQAQVHSNPRINHRYRAFRVKMAALGS
jgi:tRNA-specific adenosine deaminase 3